MTSVFEGWTAVNPDSVNPHTFVVSVEGEDFVFYRGSFSFKLKPVVVAKLINEDNFYEAINTMFSIAADPAGYGQSIADYLVKAARFIKVKKAHFSESGTCYIEFDINLTRAGLEPSNPTDRYPDYKNHDLWISISPTNLDFKSITQRVAEEYDRVAGSNHFVINLDYGLF
jgi:hypothetical protein